MAKPSEAETGMLVGGEVEKAMLVDGLVNEPVGPVLGTTRSHVAWKIFTVLVAILGLAVLGRSAGSWAAAEAGSKSVVGITPEALQKKDEEVCYANSELVDKCSGWGDPHFEQRFHNIARTDNTQIGVIPLAKSNDGNFELQGFQCLAGWSASTFAAFAVKINGKTATYFGADNANLEWHGTGPPSGLNMTGCPSDSQGFTIQSPNLCQSLWIKKITGSGYLGYYLDFGVNMVSAAPWGICGQHTVSQVLPSQRLFTPAEMNRICEMCHIKTGCEAFQPEQHPADVANMCRRNHIEWATAVEKCKIAAVHENLRKGCVFDYCATGGDMAAVENAAAESKHLN